MSNRTSMPMAMAISCFGISMGMFANTEELLTVIIVFAWVFLGIAIAFSLFAFYSGMRDRKGKVGDKALNELKELRRDIKSLKRRRRRR